MTSFVEQPVSCHLWHCALHAYDLCIMDGLQSSHFAGPLQKGSWHNWKEMHVIQLCGLVYYNFSGSKALGTFEQFSHLLSEIVAKESLPEDFLKQWTDGGKFERPAETRWEVKWRCMVLLEKRWDQLEYLINNLAKSVKSKYFTEYWLAMYQLINNKVLRLHAKFGSELYSLLLEWGYNWLKGSVHNGKDPGFRCHEVPVFANEFLTRLDTLKASPGIFQNVIDYATEIDAEFPGALNNFMENFSCSNENGFFDLCLQKFLKWFSPYFHLPKSINLIGCNNLLFESDWFYNKPKDFGHIGKEFAQALLHALPQIWEFDAQRHSLSRIPFVWCENVFYFYEDLVADLAASNRSDHSFLNLATEGWYGELMASPAMRMELIDYAYGIPCHSKKLSDYPLLCSFWNGNGAHCIQNQYTESLFKSFDRIALPTDSAAMANSRLPIGTTNTASSHCIIPPVSTSTETIRRNGNEVQVEAKAKLMVEKEQHPIPTNALLKKPYESVDDRLRKQHARKIKRQNRSPSLDLKPEASEAPLAPEVPTTTPNSNAAAPPTPEAPFAPEVPNSNAAAPPAPEASPPITLEDVVFGQPYAEEITTLFNIGLVPTDFRRLGVNQWLNDNLVNVWFLMLRDFHQQQQQQKVLFQTSNFYQEMFKENASGKLEFSKRAMDKVNYNWIKKKLKLRTNQKIKDYKQFIFPVHLPSHWVLCVVDVDNCDIAIYCSLNKSYVKDLDKDMAKIMSGLFGNEKKWNVTFPKIPLQDNGSDCGVFTCANAYDLILNGEIGRLTASKARQFRLFMLHSILDGNVCAAATPTRTGACNTCTRWGVQCTQQSNFSYF